MAKADYKKPKTEPAKAEETPKTASKTDSGAKKTAGTTAPKAKPAEKPKTEPEVEKAPKEPEVAPVFEGGCLRHGPYVDFLWVDPISGKSGISSNYHAAKYANGGKYPEPVCRWYEDGKPHHQMTAEEVRKYFP